MNFTDLIKKISGKSPGKVAVIEKENHITYREFWKRVSAAGRLYRESGIEPGDRVLIILPNSMDFLIFFFGAMKIGAIPVPVKTEYKAHELTVMINNSQPRVLVCQDKWYREGVPGLNLNAIKTRISPDSLQDMNPEKETELDSAYGAWNSDTASINYSYFEGGYPKGAVLTHGNYIYAASGYVRHLEFDPGDRFLIILPMPHVYTLSGCINASIIKGATMVFTGHYSPKSIFSDIEKYRITVFSAVPPVYEFLAKYNRKENYDLSSLRRCVTGGELMPEDFQGNFERALNTPILQGYGLTESLPVICNPPGERNKPGSLGVPGRKDIKIKIVDENNVELGTGQTGEIMLKSPTTMTGYYKSDGDTEKIIKNGWLYTGDLGQIDSDGYLYFYGMKKNLFNIYGNKIDPLEVRQVLLGHPSIEKADVYIEFSEKDTLIGNKKICGDIYIKNGKNLTAAEITGYCKEKIADYKIPKKFNIFHESVENTE